MLDTESPQSLADQQILHILQHSLGLDEYGRTRGGNRNFFGTGEGNPDHVMCEQAVARGLMTKRATRLAFCPHEDVFYVTDAGKAWILEVSPKPPKIPASKSRYRAYLDARDYSDMTFAEFLKGRWYLPPHERLEWAAKSRDRAWATYQAAMDSMHAAREKWSAAQGIYESARPRY